MGFKEILIYGGATGVGLLGLYALSWQFGLLGWISKKFNSMGNRKEIEVLKNLIYAHPELNELQGDVRITAILNFPEFNYANTLSIEQAEKELQKEIPMRNLCGWLMKSGVNKQNGLTKKFLSYSLNKTNPMIAELIANHWKPGMIKDAIKCNEVTKNGNAKQPNVPRIPVAREVESKPTISNATNSGAIERISSNDIGSNAQPRSFPSGTLETIGTQQPNPTRKSKYFD
jgi:hypothetical protein